MSNVWEVEMTRKAIVGVTDWGATKTSLRRLARNLDAHKKVAAADYHLSFADTGELMTELSPARTTLLRALKTAGPLSIYALAKQLDRAYSNVHGDVARLIRHGLIERDRNGRVFVPWDDVVIRVDASLVKAA
jgi:predicted transcriptional regulator